VRLDGEWIVVPDNAVVIEPNKFGPAVVWPYMGTGKRKFAASSLAQARKRRRAGLRRISASFGVASVVS
jgi:hypothetical protein